MSGVRYIAGRLAWLYMLGRWPDHEAKHADGDPANDRWGNLRAA
jgi:HNH endonuclease